MTGIDKASEIIPARLRGGFMRTALRGPYFALMVIALLVASLSATAAITLEKSPIAISRTDNALAILRPGLRLPSSFFVDNRARQGWSRPQIAMKNAVPAGGSCAAPSHTQLAISLKATVAARHHQFNIGLAPSRHFDAQGPPLRL